jgi:hypothetical protein
MNQAKTLNDILALGDVERRARHAAEVEAALSGNDGPRAWHEWKANALRELVELANRSPRMWLLAAGLRGDFNADYAIRMPVPRWPVAGRLVIDDLAIFHLHYQEQWRWESPPSWAPLGLWQPIDPFHPNMRPALRGACCLGKLPPGVSVKEIALLGYYALSLQDLGLDETDPYGVMNPEACEFYRQHPEYLPLTRAGLFDPWEGAN